MKAPHPPARRSREVETDANGGGGDSIAGSGLQAARRRGKQTSDLPESIQLEDILVSEVDLKLIS